MNYVSGEEVLFLHSEIINVTGGLHGVRDTHLFLSIIEKPKQEIGGERLYPTIFDAAAAQLEGFARYHVFLDGNKRTAFAVAVRLLALNGHDFNASNDEVVSFMVEAAQGVVDQEQISAWLKKHSKNLS